MHPISNTLYAPLPFSVLRYLPIYSKSTRNRLQSFYGVLKPAGNSKGLRISGIIEWIFERVGGCSCSCLDTHTKSLIALRSLYEAEKVLGAEWDRHW